MKKSQFLVIRWASVFLVIIALSAIAFAQETQDIVEHESGMYYTVQKGDTLWDLSNRFSDTPWQWPDLWEENPQIPNPHLIYPGERIRLLYDQDAEKVVEPKPTEPVVSKVDIAKPEKEPPYYYYSMIHRVGFIRKTSTDRHGIIAKSETGKVKISTGDRVYVTADSNHTLTPGSRYTIYRTYEPLKNRETKEVIGYQHYLTGILEIVKIEPQYAIAKVLKAFRAISVNDYLMPFEKRSRKIYLTGSAQNLEGKILVSEERQAVIGSDNVVFIDKGSADGVKPGQWYSIYYQENEKLDPNAKESVLLTPVVIGKLIVLLTEETTASALVTFAQSSIIPGQNICSPMK